MTDEQISEQLGLIISEMAQRREAYSEFIDEYLEKERKASLAIASGQFNLLSNPTAKKFAEAIPKPNVGEKEMLVTMELGDIGHRKAVIDAEMKMLEKNAKTLETLCFHSASLRKAERV